MDGTEALGNEGTTQAELCAPEHREEERTPHCVTERCAAASARSSPHIILS